MLGALWGIFEATVGYLLHLLPISIGWLVWYPVACFFLAAAYRKTRKAYAVLCVGAISAGIKLINLLMPISIDRVLNPSVSILFEATAMLFAILALRKTAEGSKPLIKAGAVLAMNTCWRLLYCLYILFIVPQWMGDISVLNSAEQSISFLLIDNLCSSAVIFIGSLAAGPMRRWIRCAKQRFNKTVRWPMIAVGKSIRVAAVILLLLAGAALQLLL